MAVEGGTCEPFVVVEGVVGFVRGCADPFVVVAVPKHGVVPVVEVALRGLGAAVEGVAAAALEAVGTLVRIVLG